MSAAAPVIAEKEREKVRVTLDLTQQMKEVLDRLATSDGRTQAEVLRRAIALLSAVKTAEQNGEGVPALVKDNKIVAKLVGF